LRRLQYRDGLDLASAVEQILTVTDEPVSPIRLMYVQDINITLGHMAA
jgi:hypothetical protein